MHKIEQFKNQAWNVKKVYQKERMDVNVNEHKTDYPTSYSQTQIKYKVQYIETPQQKSLGL